MENVYLVLGREEYLADNAVNEIAAGRQIEKYEEFDGDMAYSLCSEGFFSDGKVVVYAVPELGADNELLDFLQEAQLANPLVIRAEKARENTKLLNWLMKNARIVKCDVLVDRAYDKFLADEARKNGFEFSPDALAYFREKSCYSCYGSTVTLGQVAAWIHQLSLCDTVDRKRIDDIVIASAQQTAFDIVRYMSRNDEKGMMHCVNACDADPIKALSAVLWSVKLAVRLKLGPAKELGIQPFQARNVSSFVDKPDDALDDAVRILNKGISDIKNGMPQKPCFLATVYAVNARFNHT